MPRKILGDQNLVQTPTHRTFYRLKSKTAERHETYFYTTMIFRHNKIIIKRKRFCIVAILLLT